MARGLALGVALFLMTGPACNAALMVDLCDKLCDTDSDCGSAYDCRAGRCRGPDCAPADNTTSSGASGVSTSSSGVVASSSGTGTSSSSSSSSSSGGQVCVPSGGGTPCPQGSYCAANSTCTTCNTADHCGETCGDCRDLPQSVGEHQFYTCENNTESLFRACDLTPCGATVANCNNQDTDACEQDIVSSAQHCGGCGSQCESGQCSNRQCDCSPEDCPNNQVCQGGRCRCDGDDWRCEDGYQCSNNICVR